MKLFFSTSLFSFFLFISLDLPFIPDLEYTKIIKREFPASKFAMVKVLHKFGRVEVKNWDENKVKIDIRIAVEAASEAIATQIFDRINIGFIPENEILKVLTNISPERGFRSLKRDPEQEDFSIQCKVFLPTGFNVDLDVQHGEIALTNVKGRADIILKNGKLSVDKLRDARLDLSFVTGFVGYANDLNMSVDNSNLTILQAREVEIKSNNSQLKLDKTESLRLHSKYDDVTIGYVKLLKNVGYFDNITIGSAKTIIADTQNSRFNIGMLYQKLNLDMVDGSAYIEKVSEELQAINIVGDDTQFKISLSPRTNYTLDAKAYLAGINYPKDLEIINETIESNQHTVKGQKKGAVYSYANSNIKANLTKGGLRINYE